MGIRHDPTLAPPHPEEPREARRLEGSAASTRKSGLPDLRIEYCRSRVNPRSVAASWFETRRYATLLTMRRGEIVHAECPSKRIGGRAAPEILLGNFSRDCVPPHQQRPRALRALAFAHAT